MTEEKKDFWEAIENMRKAYEEQDAEFAKMADDCDPVLKLAVTQWAMKHIVAHAKEGGTYRYLIYDRLGFGTEAYAPLCSDGMTISNEFNLEDKENIKQLFKIVLEDKEESLDFVKIQLEIMKSKFNICDEKGCCEEVSCGWPTNDGGYRRTCGLHYKK